MEFSELKSYKKLEELDKNLFAQVQNVYNTVKETINSISGCFDNFTMHDIGHCVRVANYMEQLAFGIDEKKEENINRFNAAELSILLLSALLHDIGMFIRQIDRENIKNGKIGHEENLLFDGVLKVKKGNEEEAIKEIIRLTHAKRIFDYLDYQFDNGQILHNCLRLTINIRMQKI